ncbi:hypothetical protein [Roseateles amylovorans]|uniref:Uncharacterized protein n=1 Tax=Roseateles amylovorans TaxID=2978473 RepID=A0ABY6AX63_9BURK|nr:hypothetical protein [Roseateles amylovorans]UXH77562.1 hypothetical protein N4261_21625 [Roseateles amylovorans]
MRKQPERLYPTRPARTMDASEIPGFEPWCDPGADHQAGRPYGELSREGRVRFLVMSLHMQMRWRGEDGQDELQVFGPAGHVQARASDPDVDALLPTVLTALAYCWNIQPAVFVGLVNDKLGADFGVDPTVPQDCYHRAGMLSGTPLANHWLRTRP